MGELKWYALRAISGKEKKAKLYLESEIERMNLQDYIEEVFIPIEKIVEMRNGKKRFREKSFMPGYMLVKADLSSGEVAHTITSTPNIIGFLQERGVDGEGKDSLEKVPVPLRDSEVNRILGRVEESDAGEQVEEGLYNVGEQVLVNDGPFSGFNGSIEEVFHDKKKLNVMVKIFGRNTPVELSYSQVEKQ